MNVKETKMKSTNKNKNEQEEEKVTEEEKTQHKTYDKIRREKDKNQNTFVKND